jgi:hypothetical protein
MCVSDQWCSSPLELAVLHKNQAFVGSAVVQSLLAKAWMGDLQHNTATMRLIGATVFPVLIPLLLQMKEGPDNTAMQRTPPNATPNLDSSQQTASTTKHHLKKFLAFYSSPVGRFSLNLVSYMLFLCLFCYSLLVRWDRHTPTWPELLTMFWIVSFAAEDMHQLISTPGRSKMNKFCRWLFNVVGLVKLFGLLFYTVGSILHFAPYNMNEFYPNTFRWARKMWSLAACLFFLRCLEFFFVNRELGPKLTMIYKMMVDVIVFMCILLVWVLSYGVAVQALLFPFQEASWDLLFKVIEVPYWQIHGEIFLEHLSGEATDNCVPTPRVHHTNSSTSYSICPQKEWLVVLLLALYLIITVVVLLNLLIAIFNDTYQGVRVQATMIWKFQRYHVIINYMTNIVFPHPFYWFSLLARRCTKKKQSGLRIERENVKQDVLHRFNHLERHFRNKVLHLNRQQKSSSQ